MRARSAASSYIAAVSGTSCGWRYELALATDYIMLVDDKSSAVSCPETPLLAVLPRDWRPYANRRQSEKCGAIARMCSPRSKKALPPRQTRGRMAVGGRGRAEVRMAADGACARPRECRGLRPAGCCHRRHARSLEAIVRWQTTRVTYQHVSIEIDREPPRRQPHGARPGCAGAEGRGCGARGRRRVLAARDGA